MDMIVGCIFLSILLVILFIFCKNVTFNVTISYPQPQNIKIDDGFDSEGNPRKDEGEVNFDDLLKEVNSVLLDVEEE